MRIIKLYIILNIILVCTYVYPNTNYLTDSTEIELKSGLVFKSEIEHRTGDSTYTDYVQLMNLTDKAQALQFRILINKAPDDNNILIINSIQKGSDINDPGWLLEYNTIQDASNQNGATKDEILVLLYDTKLDGGLIPGSYSSLIEINYGVIDIPNAKSNIKSSMRISNAEASTSNGNPIDITSNMNELKIFLKSK